MATSTKKAKTAKTTNKTVASGTKLDLAGCLNPAQLEAVTAPNGPQLVVAGAGSG